jgi:hypothetical protein
MAMVSYARWSEKSHCDTADLAAGTWITTCGGGAAGAMREGRSPGSGGRNAMNLTFRRCSEQ